MDDIFQEVDEELRAERTRRAFRRYGGFGIAAVLVAIAGLGFWQAWEWQQRQKDAAAAATYLKAMQGAESILGTGQTPGREAAIANYQDVADKAPEGYRTLALLRLAALRADGGDKAGAIAGWRRLADDKSADGLLQDLANLFLVEAQLATGDPDILQAQLDKLTGPTNPWHGLAKEAEALLELRQGKTDAARKTLRILAQDTTAPDGVRGRANDLLVRLGGG